MSPLSAVDSLSIMDIWIQFNQENEQQVANLEADTEKFLSNFSQEKQLCEKLFKENTSLKNNIHRGIQQLHREIALFYGWPEDSNVKNELAKLKDQSDLELQEAQAALKNATEEKERLLRQQSELKQNYTTSKERLTNLKQTLKSLEEEDLFYSPRLTGKMMNTEVRPLNDSQIVSYIIGDGQNNKLISLDKLENIDEGVNQFWSKCSSVYNE